MRISSLILLFLLSALIHIDASSQSAIEKVYIHFDKPYYLQGETSWFKVYVVQNDLTYSDISGVLYVDWVSPSGKIVKHQKLKLYSGETDGDYTFNDTITGAYMVRAYTNFMRNDDDAFFFSKIIHVFGGTADNTAKNDSLKKIDVQFFPESGNAVAGIETNIAFKAIDENGHSIKVSGKIIDDGGNAVADFSSIHDGMGRFPYVPVKGKQYHVKLSTGEIFNLPETVEAGVVMNANNAHEEKVFVKVHGSPGLSLGGYMLTASSHGKIIFNRRIQTRKNEITVEFSKTGIPGGIVQLTLFNQSNIPCAERVIFIRPGKTFTITAETNKKQFSPRDSISFSITAADGDGQPVETELSLSITDASMVTPDASAENILTSLMLQSDLKGTIENPGWYFNNKNRSATYALDLVMMTHGWRKYDTTRPIVYAPEIGLRLQGTVKIRDSEKRLPNAKLTLLVAGIDFNNLYTTESDSEGRFVLPGVDFSDSSKLIWQIQNGKGKMINADVVLDHIPDTTIFQGHKLRIAGSDIARRMAEFQVNTNPGVSNATVLEQVVVTGRRRSGQIGADARLIRPSKDEEKMMAYNFISKYAVAIPFAKAMELPNNEGTIWVTGRENKEIKIIIDGYPYEDRSPAGGPFFVLNSYRTDQLEYVIVAGNPHNGYRIIIKTRNTPNSHRGILHQSAEGYQFTRSFYHPKYGPNQPTTPRDSRTTLYWNPYVITDAEGKATITFYNSDNAKKFIITAEGISNGSLGTFTKEY